jgi:hypothetical protein
MQFQINLTPMNKFLNKSRLKNTAKDSLMWHISNIHTYQANLIHPYALLVDGL